MGAQMVYLSEPVTGKEVDDGGDLGVTGLHYGLSAMQGWRRNMEDAHLAVTELDKGISLFGVFDGHGGRGVSRFAAGRLPDILKDTEEYQRADYARALEKAFLRVDELLREAPGRREIETLDRPDPGAVTHPVVVPRKALQRFLGAQEAAHEERQLKSRAPAAKARSAAPAAGAEEPVEGGEDKENRPEAAAGGLEEPETEEEAQTEGDGEHDYDADEDGGMALVDPARLTRDPTPEAQGCTAVVVLVVRREEGGGPQLFCANAGDSRAVLSRGGRVVALSEDHKPENPGETARIVKAGGYVQQMPGGARVQGDLNLSRAMGDLRYKKPETLPPEEQIVTAFPEVRIFPLTGEDEFMVIGCDGIWERIGNQEIVDFVRTRLGLSGKNGRATALSEICREICDNGLCPSMDTQQNTNFDGTGCDNMTVMIVQLKRLAEKRPGEEAEGEGPVTKQPRQDTVEEEEQNNGDST